MPELPEVETVRRGVSEWVRGRVVDAVEVRHPRAVRRHVAGVEDFRALMRGVAFDEARRRGKFMWLPLDSGDALMCHLGMSGQLLVQPSDLPDETHLRVRVAFAGCDRQLRFVDQRTFGGMWVSPDGAQRPAEIAHIAPDVYDPEFSLETFTRSLLKRRTDVKRALLDQTLMSGVGNIYADEALWRARLHGRRRADGLTRREAASLVDQVRAVFDAALDAGGTSFDALYVNVNGESGYFDRKLAVYGREGLTCRRCDAIVRREKFAGRSSYFCPACQPIR
ncbi:MAG: bifunctional DNA-formamidopyrimidine glycosylase/DNA-(apurinic or apyrimidinic site) lyase [Stackebrandtia sp.]